MGAGQVIVQTVLILPDLDLHVGHLLCVLWLLFVHLEINETRACLKYQYISLWNRYFHTTDWYLLVQYVQVFQKWNIVFLVFEVKPSMDMKFIIKTKIYTFSLCTVSQCTVIKFNARFTHSLIQSFSKFHLY